MLIAPSNPIIKQPGIAEPLPQAQPDVSELYRYDFPRQRHPQGRRSVAKAADPPNGGLEAAAPCKSSQRARQVAS